MNDKLAAKRFYISGLVQGVGYRLFAERVAEQLGLGGYAKNLRDGRVEVYAIGNSDHFSKLREQLKRGPRAASVSDVTEEDAPMDERYKHQFTIEYDSW